MILPFTVLRRLDCVLAPTTAKVLEVQARFKGKLVFDGKTVWLVSCQRSPEPVFLKWKSLEASADGDFYVRSGPRTDRLGAESARQYVKTRFADSTA